MRYLSSIGMVEYSFHFLGNEWPGRQAGFRHGFGVLHCGIALVGGDVGLFTNVFLATGAVLGGKMVDPFLSTVVEPHSWGDMKNSIRRRRPLWDD